MNNLQNSFSWQRFSWPSECFVLHFAYLRRSALKWLDFSTLLHTYTRCPQFLVRINSYTDSRQRISVNQKVISISRTCIVNCANTASPSHAKLLPSRRLISQQHHSLSLDHAQTEPVWAAMLWRLGRRAVNRLTIVVINVYERFFNFSIVTPYPITQHHNISTVQ